MEENLQTTPQNEGQQPKQQEKIVMILVCWFLGTLGIHRLMMGYKNWWVMLITLGGCGIWEIIDLVQIIMDKMPMADGRPLIQK